MKARYFLCIVFYVMIFSLKDGFSVDKKIFYESIGQKFRYEVLLQQYDVIWGFDFLSSDKIIFTQRSGKINTFDLKTKIVTSIGGAPAVWHSGQGGLLDIKVHPLNPLKIYMTYCEPVGKLATTALASAMLSENKLMDFKKLFVAHEPNDNKIHFGSRIEFDGKGHLFVTIGDRDERSHVQDLAYHTGKIIRLKDDGSVPSDNPFIKTKGARPEIWSLGHRSPQGLVRHPTTGDVWMSEMGPRGGDEINLIKPGLNYGWPVVTYGREYYGLKIGEGTSKQGMEGPVVYWVPSISPSGMTIYNGEVFPKWKGDLFIGNLSGKHLRRLVLEGGKVKSQEELLNDLKLRIRNVRSGPDGLLYFSTDDGKLARLVPFKN